MPTDTKLQQLIINTLTAEQMPASPSPTEIWLQEDTGEYATEEYVNNHHDDTKQDKLTAGANITIDESTNTISATGGSSSVDWDDITNKPTSLSDFENDIDEFDNSVTFNKYITVNGTSSSDFTGGITVKTGGLDIESGGLDVRGSIEATGSIDCNGSLTTKGGLNVDGGSISIYGSSTSKRSIDATYTDIDFDDSNIDFDGCTLDMSNVTVNSMAGAEFDCNGAEFNLSGSTITYIEDSTISADGKSYLAGLGMPSTKETDLVLGASGATYTAPANGWFVFSGGATSGTKFVTLQKSSVIVTGLTVSGISNANIVLPVKKDDVVSAQYSADTTLSLKFIYAEGAK